MKAGTLRKRMKRKSGTNVGVLGYGEVGQAVAEFYDNPRIKDLTRDDGLEGIDILHICIPWSNKFVSVVRKQINELKPKLTIIHSTVALGTTSKLALSLSKGTRVMIVHSPIRGTHPHLHEGVKTFVKYVGADDKKAGEFAKQYLESLGIRAKLLMPSMTSEALKLWDTTQYGWMIILNKEIRKWCDERGLDFNAVYTDANESYNEGYQRLGRSEVFRPYLKYMPGKIGGHCVIPNCRLLDGEVAKLIMRKNRSYEE